MARKKKEKGETVTKPFYKRWWFIALAVIFIIGALGGDDEEAQDATEPETEEVDVVEEVEPETTEVEEAEAEEATEVTEAVEEEIEEEAVEFDNVFEEKAHNVFGDRVRTVEAFESEGIFYVSVSSDISAGWNERTTRDSFYRETADFLEQIKDEEFDETTIMGYAEMQDQLGNVEESMVLSSRFTKELVNEINYDNFIAENIPDVADGAFIHPAFQD